MNPETQDGQADRHLYLEQISPFWKTFLRGGEGKGLEKTAPGDKEEENEKQKLHTTLKTLTWRAREDSRGSNNPLPTNRPSCTLRYSECHEPEPAIKLLLSPSQFMLYLPLWPRDSKTLYLLCSFY